MAYARRIRDIQQGSIWIDADDGSQVIIVSAGNAYVQFMRGRDRIEIFYIEHFRRRFTPYYDRAKVRSDFSMRLANLGTFRVYWLPCARKIMARSIGCTRQFAVRAGAQLVGTYSAPCDPEAFLADLDDVIRRSPATVALEA